MERPGTVQGGGMESQEVLVVCSRYGGKPRYRAVM